MINEKKNEKFKKELDLKEAEIQRKVEAHKEHIIKKRDEISFKILERKEKRAISLQQMQRETKKLAKYGISTKIDEDLPDTMVARSYTN